MQNIYPILLSQLSLLQNSCETSTVGSLNFFLRCNKWIKVQAASARGLVTSLQCAGPHCHCRMPPCTPAAAAAAATTVVSATLPQCTGSNCHCRMPPCTPAAAAAATTITTTVVSATLPQCTGSNCHCRMPPCTPAAAVTTTTTNAASARLPPSNHNN
ncbi:unnamed protein product [Vicia faba]|uniref:Uncharacterized protein n=1 Tax=Vicia faba TaxID=3906 RepID=A0AAV0YEG4_VICFA|nr:unnamed protein product [Vicia faba]